MSDFAIDSPVTDQNEFNLKWVFNNFRLYTVTNPLTETFKFKCTTEVGFSAELRKPVTETREYEVVAGGSQRFPGPVAGLYLDQMSKLKAQKDGKFGQIIDWSFRDEMYQKLVADMEDLVDNYKAFPQYDKPMDQGLTEAKNDNGGDGTPFAEAKNGRTKETTAKS